ncbi:zinc finger protein 790-like [Hydractinia symbiolongicarpus]|uniref:zinc finger protein 790-like n=1 Tax=Hydractinia symbiolongicarpus TaxID=13093 RepID=UPI00254AC353|nr:zinc finger protein 790-like [Hydractinia symbiolongicarpus]
MTTTRVCPQGQKRVNMDGTERCSKCNFSLSLDNFMIKVNGQLTKMWIKCLNIAKVSRKHIKCPHERVRAYCKECKGCEICHQERQSGQCRDCGGSHISPHQRVRSRCKECGSNGICKHGRRRTECKECGSGSICHHQRIRSICKDCGGRKHMSSSRQGSLCKECGVEASATIKG